MLLMEIKGKELYNENNGEIIVIKSQEIQLEHSLVSISKWESKWKKPFISKEPMTREETLDYIKCMTITPKVNPLLYSCITNDNIKKVYDYINDPMTATTFTKNNGPNSREIITSEIIYYWMIALNIPQEYQKWHLNRLFTLIEVCNRKNQPNKKMSKRDILSRNRSLNAARRAKTGSKG